MANTKALSKDERKKSKRTARKKTGAQEKTRLPTRQQEIKSEETGARRVQALSL